MRPDQNVVAFPARAANHALRRPRILVRAARAGQTGWRRQRDLPRLLRCEDCPAPDAALRRLRAEEAALDGARRARSAEYDLKRHVLLMIAILAEMRAASAAAGSRPMGRATCPGTANPARP